MISRPANFLDVVLAATTESYGLDHANPYQGLWASTTKVRSELSPGAGPFDEPGWGRVHWWLEDDVKAGLLEKHPSGGDAYRVKNVFWVMPESYVFHYYQDCNALHRKNRYFRARATMWPKWNLLPCRICEKRRDEVR